MTTRRWLPALWAALGIALIAGAAVSAFAIAPGLTKLSTRADGTAVYVGTTTVPAADGSGTTDVPLEIESSLTVQPTTGNTAIVSLRSEAFETPRKPGARPMGVESHTYALDRETLGQAGGPASGVEDQHGGLTISFPADPPRHGLAMYDSLSQTTGELDYVRSERVGGRDADIFSLRVAGLIKDPATVKPLQAGFGAKFGTDGTWLPKAALSAFGVPDIDLTAMPDRIPVTYTSTTTAEYVVDREFGAVIDVHKSVKTQANLNLPGVASAPAIPLSSTTTNVQDHYKQTLIQRLNAAGTMMAILSTWAPLGMPAVGLLLIGRSAWLVFRRHSARTVATDVVAAGKIRQQHSSAGI